MLEFNVVSVLSVNSVKCFRNSPEQTRGVMKGKAGSERFLILPKVWWHCINTLIIPCVAHEPATGQRAVIMFITQASLVPV